jgi:hypothetical protein
MSIMPSSRNTTFQSMPACSLKTACSASVAPMSSISTAPPSAAATRWIFSVAMSAYAPTKTATASHAVTLTCLPPGRASR